VRSPRPKLLIVGGSGLLGTNTAIQLRDHYEVVLALHNRMITIPGTDSVKIDFSDKKDLEISLANINPDVILNAAAVANVEQCEASPQRAYEVNVELPKALAEYSSSARSRLVHMSTDQLFDGRDNLYNEEHPCSPLNVYAVTKKRAENEVLMRDSSALVIRTNFFGWGPGYRMSFSDWILEQLKTRKNNTLFTDVYFTPILVDSLITVMEELWNTDLNGVWNVCGSERISKFQFGRLLAKVFHQDVNLLTEGHLAGRTDLVRRPLDMSLDNTKLLRNTCRKLPSLQQQMKFLAASVKPKYLREIRVA
jgi:dTDP-4-dehydrorhamnose reductase